MIKDAAKGVDRIHTYDDEVSIVDLWLILVKRKWVVVLILLLSVSIAALVSLGKKDRYRYVSTIELGSSVLQESAGDESQSAVVLVEPPETTLAKLNEAYIPSILNSTDGGAIAIEIEAHIPANSQLIVIESVSSLPKADQRAMHEKIMVLLQKDHEVRLALWRRTIEHKLEEQEIALAALQDPVLLLNKKQAIKSQLTKTKIELERLQTPYALLAREERVKTNLESAKLMLDGLARSEKLLVKKQRQLETERQLLEGEISDLGRQIEQALQRSMDVGARASDGIDGIALLLIDNVIQENRSRLALLELRLQIKLPERTLMLKNDLRGNQQAQLLEMNKIGFLREELDQVKIVHERERTTTRLPVDKLNLELQQLDANHGRAIEAKLVLVKQLNSRLSAINETKFLVPPVYAGIVGLSFTNMVLLAMVVGLMLGVFMVFFMEFLRAVRIRQVGEALLIDDQRKER